MSPTYIVLQQKRINWKEFTQFIASQEAVQVQVLLINYSMAEGHCLPTIRKAVESWTTITQLDSTVHWQAASLAAPPSVKESQRPGIGRCPPPVRQPHLLGETPGVTSKSRPTKRPTTVAPVSDTTRPPQFTDQAAAAAPTITSASSACPPPRSKAARHSTAAPHSTGPPPSKAAPKPRGTVLSELKESAEAALALELTESSATAHCLHKSVGKMSGDHLGLPAARNSQIPSPLTNPRATMEVRRASQQIMILRRANTVTKNGN